MVYIDNFQVIPGFDLQSASPFYVEKFIIEFLKEQKVSRVSRGVYLSLTYAVGLFIVVANLYCRDVRVTGILAAYFNTFNFEDLTVLEALT